MRSFKSQPMATTKGHCQGPLPRATPTAKDPGNPTPTPTPHLCCQFRGAASFFLQVSYHPACVQGQGIELHRGARRARHAVLHVPTCASAHVSTCGTTVGRCRSATESALKIQVRSLQVPPAPLHRLAPTTLTWRPHSTRRRGSTGRHAVWGATADG